MPANETYLQRVYLIAPPGSDAAQSDATDVRLWVEDISNGDRAHKDTVFNGRGE